MCETAWYDEFLELNPEPKKRRDVIARYAERQGGVVFRYLFWTFPRYWQSVEGVPVDAIGERLGLTPADEARILANMSKAVRAAMDSSPGSGLLESSRLEFPKTVRHLP